MSPEELDEAVFGSAAGARWADVGATVDLFAEQAARHLRAGKAPGEAAMAIEHSLGYISECDNFHRAVAALSNALVQLALTRLPQPAAGERPKRIRQWVVTDPYGREHVFEDELRAMRAAFREPHNTDQLVQLVTPDGDRFTIMRGRR